MTHDKRDRLELFLKASRIFFVLLFTILLIACMVYLYMDEVTYNLIILFLIVCLVLVIFVTGLLVYVVVSAYRTGKINKTFALVVRMFIKLIMSTVIELGALFKMDKNLLRGFFVDINNILVSSTETKCNSDKILVLVPHCLQWADCSYKITHNAYNCKRCGQCNIDEILTVGERYHVNICVASGGTMARKAVQEYKPKVIISVACNRDLISGILDIDDIPVIAIENRTPQGPCFNTEVDVEKIEQAILRIIVDKE